MDPVATATAAVRTVATPVISSAELHSAFFGGLLLGLGWLLPLWPYFAGLVAFVLVARAIERRIGGRPRGRSRPYYRSRRGW